VASTGFDLVEWQLRIAAGEPLANWLSNGQADVALHGPRDAKRACTPKTRTTASSRGPAASWHWAARRDGAYRPRHRGGRRGHAVGTHAMVAKLIVHGHDRADGDPPACRSHRRDTLGSACTNNGRFLRDLLQHEDFAAARLTTTRLDEWAAEAAPLMPAAGQRVNHAGCAAVALAARGELPAGAPAGLRPASVATQTLALPMRRHHCANGASGWMAMRCTSANRTWCACKAARATPGGWASHGAACSIVAVREPNGAWHLAHEGTSLHVHASPRPALRRATALTQAARTRRWPASSPRCW